MARCLLGKAGWVHGVRGRAGCCWLSGNHLGEPAVPLLCPLCLLLLLIMAIVKAQGKTRRINILLRK